MSASPAWPRSLHGRLVALVLGLLLALGAVSLVAVLKGSRLFAEEVQFRLDQGVAEHIAETVQPFADGEVAVDELKKLFMDVMVINPSLEVYLIDREGELLAYDAPEERIVRRRVDLGPVERFLEGHEGRTVRGDDPRSASGRKPVSVHPVEADGTPMGYLYIILGGQGFDSVFATLQQSYILRYAAALLAGALAVTSVVGVFALGVMTRPLRRLRRAISRYPAGEGGAAEPLRETEDELRALERAYRSMAQRIDEQMRELRENDERRREFVASISHDLRTPTSAVQGYLEALIDRRERLSEAERVQYMEVALRQSRRLAGLVERLFELARLEAVEAAPSKETFSLAELVQDIVVEFQAAAERRGVALRARFPFDLPPVHADIGLIERALDNLIDNALRFTPRGGEVAVTLAEAPGGVEVAVSDSGPGIEPERLPRLFDRFYRVSSSGAGGAGLGLAITKRIVDLHQSSIRVESRPEKGTTFTFVLASAAGEQQGPSLGRAYGV